MAAVADASAASALAELLRRPRYEVLPLDGIEDDVAASLGTDVTITVTGSPSRGLDATLDLSERLAARGYRVVPHLPARQVRDAAHLDELLDRIEAAGIRRLFVPAGDTSEPAGRVRRRRGAARGDGPAARRLRRDRHHRLPREPPPDPDEETIRAMFAKAEMATDIISQICFDADTIATGSPRSARAARGCRSGSACPGSSTIASSSASP